MIDRCEKFSSLATLETKQLIRCLYTVVGLLLL